jgi:hypothetical protein
LAFGAATGRSDDGPVRYPLVETGAWHSGVKRSGRCLTGGLGAGLAWRVDPSTEDGRKVHSMALIRLGSASIPRSRAGTRGLCGGCGKPISKRDVTVRLYGELFHRDCALHPVRSAG